MWERQILRRGPRYIVHASWNLQARVPQSPLTFRRQRLRRDVCLSCMRVDGCSLFCVSMRGPKYMNCLRCSSMPCRPWLGRVPVLTIINGNFRFLSLQRLLFGSHETYNELSTQLSTSSVAVYREAFRGLCPYCPTIVCVPFPMAHLKDFLRFLWNLILFRRSFHISILYSLDAFLSNKRFYGQLQGGRFPNFCTLF